jgi:hypothetical protein
MIQKSRVEIITDTIVSDGKPESFRAAWQYLRSVSAKNEAEMISVSQQAQSDIVSTIAMLKPKKFAEYKTDKTLNEIKSILGKMIGDSEVLARRLITANFLAGKIRNVEQSHLSGPQAVGAIVLSDADRTRIDGMVAKVIGNIQRGAALAQASVSNMLTNTAIRANQVTRPIVKPEPSLPNDKTKDKTKAKQPESKPKEEKVDQEPLSMTTEQEPVKQKRPNKIYKDIPPTQEELDSIRKNPIVYANIQAKGNVDFVTKLHNAYLHTANTPVNSIQEKKERELAAKEAGSSVNAQAIFELNKSLQMNGLYAFFDKGGKRWTLQNYCAMSIRTMSAQSTNLGEVFADEEHDLYFIVPHGGSCPLCKKYEGRVYSRSGKDKRYPPLSSAFSKIDPNGTDDLDNTYMSIHPNCRHKIVKYIENTHTKIQRKKIIEKSNKPFELTKAQEKAVQIQKQREAAWNDREAAMREFKMYLQLLPPKDVCGNFVKFYEHKQKNDSVYKEVKRKYEEALKAYNIKK